MLAKRELRQYSGDIRVWVGKYKNLTNLPHWHYDCELIFAEKGSATVYVNGKAFYVAEKQAVFVGSREAHYIKADNGCILSFFLFDFKLVKHVVGDRALDEPLLKKDYGLEALFQVIDDELSSDFPLRILSVNNRIERLVIDIFSHERTRAASSVENYHTTNYKKLLKDIDEKFADYTLSDAASFLSLSESYFSKFFKNMADMTFSQYLNLVRVEKAIEMMRLGDYTMTKIAIDCGFNTIRNFNRVFRSVTGFSPKQLPKSYDTLGMHPTYGVEDTFDPTDEGSVLIGSDDV